MRFRQLGILLAIATVLTASAFGTARASFSEFQCPHPWAEIPLGDFVHEFPTMINSAGGDSVDIIVNAVLPSGWFWQLCQESTGICYFDNVRVFVDETFDPDILRMDFFPDTNNPGVGYIQLEVRLVDDPLSSRYCTYTLFNGVPEVVSNIEVDCADNTAFTETGTSVIEFFTPITNATALDDSVHITPTLDVPGGWFSQFCQTSTGICYFSEATVALAAGFTDTIRVDFFPGSDGAGTIKMDYFSTNNPSIFRKCGYNVFQGEDGFPSSTPEGFSNPSTVASFAQPNPFVGDTSIRFRLSEAAHGDLGIFSADGREVRLMRGVELSAGESEVRWDGRDEFGASVPSGVYFYRFESGVASAKGLMVKSR
ncbi:MAG: FlgD immunoglobulin-like domain containing protein [Candidatus Eisenbacteria bacterium]